MALPSSPFVTQAVRPGHEPALAICRGVRRALADRGYASIVEFSLANGRRADVLAMDDAGHVVIVEVKSGVADFRADQKWQDYLEYCDAFYFAVDADFPQELIPAECGLMVADGFGAEVLREGPVAKMNPARRKALVLRAALTASQRLHRLEDPGRGM
ncbi:MAG TPA: MmcB family DNA repair protein [Azospirillaceae bacterium]|nr:MmcB family DNA repair protein [Azospirillaceae bacterium]